MARRRNERRSWGVGLTLFLFLALVTIGGLVAFFEFEDRRPTVDKYSLSQDLEKKFGGQPQVEFVCRFPVVGIAPCILNNEKETQSLVIQALHRLPENQREVIQLKFQHGMSYRQIGAVTSRTTSYVGYLIHAGLKAIRHEIGDSQLKDTGS